MSQESKEKTNSTRQTIDFTADQLRSLKHIADQQGSSLTFQIRTAIKEYIAFHQLKLEMHEALLRSNVENFNTPHVVLGGKRIPISLLSLSASSKNSDLDSPQPKLL